MKRENFERAAIIDNSVKQLMRIDKLLTNASAGRHRLAAVDIDCYDKATMLCDELLPPMILAKFRQVLADEILKLDKEFESL